ncbi:MAG TPA: hypothetical protein VJT50_07340 [Pyrinomonadaceae bacterium]|nr:hypothetical protein [Pyrinomonadaceae bacterium]
MSTVATENLKSGSGVMSLWAGVLLGPIAALSQLEANYALVLWACNTSHEWPLHLVSIAALCITLVGGALAYGTFSRLRASQEDGPGTVPRARLMAAVGVLISIVMSLVIIAQWIPVFVYGPCQR